MESTSTIRYGSYIYGKWAANAVEANNGIKVASTQGAFAAIRTDGSVTCWGYDSYGANFDSVMSSLTTAVTDIYSTLYAFAALKENGQVITWGLDVYGGDSSSVVGMLGDSIKTLSSTAGAFAALTKTGSVVTWGYDQVSTTLFFFLSGKSLSLICLY